MKKQSGHNEPILRAKGKFTTLSKMKKNLWTHMAEDMCREGLFGSFSFSFFFCH